ncbi:MAG: hypothetical protein ACM3Q0_02370 [Bacteroidota bacterium]|jgi:hypothetical protein
MALSTKRPSAKDRLIKEMQDTAGPTKRMNIDVDAALYRRMKRQALEEDRTLSEITRELWTEYLRKHSAE